MCNGKPWEGVVGRGGTDPTLILERAVWQLWEEAWQGQRASSAASLNPCLVHALPELVPPAQPNPVKQVVSGAPRVFCLSAGPCEQLCAPRKRCTLINLSRHCGFSTNLSFFLMTHPQGLAPPLGPPPPPPPTLSLEMV